MIPDSTELTTVHALTSSSVSRKAHFPIERSAKQRRILMEDVMTYKHRIDQEREPVLDQLAADAQTTSDQFKMWNDLTTSILLR
jgi:hypothetical protein